MPLIELYLELELSLPDAILAAESDLVTWKKTGLYPPSKSRSCLPLKLAADKAGATLNRISANSVESASSRTGATGYWTASALKSVEKNQEHASPQAS
jgi:hypothetical protein